MEWIEGETVRLCCPGLADELVGGEAFEGLEPGEVVGRDEVSQVAAELVVGPRSHGGQEPAHAQFAPPEIDLAFACLVNCTFVTCRHRPAPRVKDFLVYLGSPHSGCSSSVPSTLGSTFYSQQVWARCHSSRPSRSR